MPRKHQPFTCSTTLQGPYPYQQMKVRSQPVANITKKHGGMQHPKPVVPEKWKRVENQAYPLRPMVQFWWFQCVIWEKSKHCVHMKRDIYCQNSSIMSQQHSFENKSWPLMTLKFDLLTFSLYRSMHQNWQKCFKILIFQTKYTLMGWPWPSVVMVST